MIGLIGAGSSVGRYLLALNNTRFIGIYRSPKSLSQLCDLNVGGRLARVSSVADMTRAIVGCETVVNLINDENPCAALASLKEIIQACIDADVPQLIHISSASIYGAHAACARDASDSGSLITWNSYAAGKKWQELHLKRCKKLPRSTVVLRPGLIWGPGMAWLHIPACEILRGDAWIVEGDAPCNLTNINFLLHAIYYVAATRPVGLFFSNLRDFDELVWAKYYANIARTFGVNDMSLTELSRAYSNSWKNEAGAARSTFPWGLGWSILNRPFKTLIKRTAKKFGQKPATLREVVLARSGPRVSITRETWELKTANGLPPSGCLLKELHATYPRTADQDWSQLECLREWMIT